jgi:hypothetical protein
MRKNGTVASEILDTIDGALRDYGTSKDAMRWAPPPAPVQEECTPLLNAAPFAYGASAGATLEMLGAWAAAIAAIEEGHIVTVRHGDNEGTYRVTGRHVLLDGKVTFDLEPVHLA